MNAKKIKLRKGERLREDGRFEYRYKKKSVYSRDINELREKEEQLKRDELNGINFDKKSLTIDEAYEEWKRTKSGIKPSTFSNYCYMYEKFVYDGFGRNKVRDIKKSDIKKYYNSIYNGNVMKVSTLDTIHTVLHEVLELAKEDKFIQYNPADKALFDLKSKANKDREFKNMKNKVKKALSRTEEYQFFKFLSGRIDGMDTVRWKRIFRFLILTGLRISEFCALQKNSIDYQNKTITVDCCISSKLVKKNEKHKKGCKEYYVSSTKTPAGTRTLPLTSRLEKLVKEELEWQQQAGLICKAELKNEDGDIVLNDFLFLNINGSFYTESSINKTLKSIIKRYNETHEDKIQNVYPHKFRKTFATRLKEANVTEEVRKTFLGHSQDDVTNRVYTDITDYIKIVEINKFSDLYDKLEKGGEFLLDPILDPKKELNYIKLH